MSSVLSGFGFWIYLFIFFTWAQMFDEGYSYISLIPLAKSPKSSTDLMGSW